MVQISFQVNGKQETVEVDPQTTLLWVLRDHLGLTGTKYGCGIAMCGSCTVHVEGTATRACILPAAALDGKSVTTIEGLSEDGSHPVQKAWVQEQVPQCGYCQSGQIMQAVSLLEKNPDPTDEQIKSHMNGVLCRCGTYMRIMKAIKSASKEMQP